MIDFVIIFLIYVYYQTCSFWAVSHSLGISLSEDTAKMIKEFLEDLNDSNESQVQKLAHRRDSAKEEANTDQDKREEFRNGRNWVAG